MIISLTLRNAFVEHEHVTKRVSFDDRTATGAPASALVAPA